MSKSQQWMVQEKNKIKERLPTEIHKIEASKVEYTYLRVHTHT